MNEEPISAEDLRDHLAAIEEVRAGEWVTTEELVAYLGLERDPETPARRVAGE